MRCEDAWVLKVCFPMNLDLMWVLMFSHQPRRIVILGIKKQSAYDFGTRWHPRTGIFVGGPK